jgi:hypothetical protein
LPIRKVHINMSLMRLMPKLLEGKLLYEAI